MCSEHMKGEEQGDVKGKRPCILASVDKTIMPIHTVFVTHKQGVHHS